MYKSIRYTFAVILVYNSFNQQNNFRVFTRKKILTLFCIVAVMAATMFNNTMPISLDSILQVKPDTWTSASYSGRLYVTEELITLSTEYEEISRDIRSQGISGTISKIERVQHPFAYGRFLIRKEQLEKRNGCAVQPIRKFYKVSNAQIKEALEYNMDDRRATSISSSLYSVHDCCVVVVQQLAHSKTRDSEVYPEYVVYLD